MFKFLKNYFKKPERKQYILPHSYEITVYFDGKRWYDCILNSYALGHNNEYPLLVEGTMWDPLRFKNFKSAKNALEIIDKLSFVDPEFIFKNIVDEFIANPIVKLNKGFIRINELVPFTKKWYHYNLNDNLTYVMWLVNDAEFTLAMLLNNLSKDSILLKNFKEHLLEHLPIR